MSGARSRSSLPLWISGSVLVALMARFWFVCDDAYILFRYSKNLAAGHGLTFNVGDPAPVEGFSELLWTLFCALPEAAGVPAPRLAPLVTALGSLLLLVLLLRYGRDRLGLGTLGLVAAGLFYGANPTVAIWSSGGLSSSLSALLIFLCFRALFPGGSPDGESSPARGLEAGLYGSLACLMRADGPIWIGVLLVLFGVSTWLGRAAPGRLRAGRGALLRALALLAVVGAGLVLWRLQTFGDYLPNTARAKVGLSTLSLERGGKYALHYLVIVPVAAASLVAGLLHVARGLAGPERRLDALGAATLTAAATFAYGVLVGGDFMAMGRFFFPAVPFLALVFGARVEASRARLLPSLAWGWLLVGSVLPAFDRHLAPAAVREALWFRWSDPAYVSELAFWEGMRDRVREWALVGKACGQRTRPGESLVLKAIGAVGYYSQLTILDQHGLIDARVLEATAPASVRATPGHDRLVDQAFFDAYGPTYQGAWLSRQDESLRQLDPLRGYVVTDLEGRQFEGRYLVLRRWGPWSLEP